MLTCTKITDYRKVARTILIALLLALSINLIFWQESDASQTANQFPLVITEVLYDPAGEDMVMTSGHLRSRQWIEVYNQSEAPVQIIGGIGEEVWTFIDSTGTHFFAKAPAQGMLTIAPHEYIILAGDAYLFKQEYPWYTGTIIDTRMELQHQYDFVQIKNQKGEIMAQALWSYNIGGQGNGKTLEFYGPDDVRESALIGGTPGQPNQSSNPIPITPSPTPSPLLPKETITNKPYTPQALSVGKVIINELFPNGASTNGWIELWNLEPYPVNLQGWKIQTLNQTLTISTSTIIQEYGFLATKEIQPSQTGDIVKLLDGQNTLLFEVEYQTTIPEGWAVARFPAGWAITAEPTKAQNNIWSIPLESSLLPSPIAREMTPDLSPTSTLLAQFFSPKSPLVVALATAVSGTVSFILLRRKLIP